MKKSGLETDSRTVTNHLIGFCTEKALERFEIDPIWGPVSTPGTTPGLFKLDQEFKFSIQVDSQPEVEWPDFATLTIQRPVKNITDEMIQNEMHEQQLDVGEKVLNLTEIQIGDEIECKILMTDKASGDEIFSIEKSVFRIPRSGRFNIFQVILENVANHFVDKKIGDEFSISTTIQRDYFDPTLSEKDVDITFSIREAKTIKPASVEDVVEAYGTPNEAVLLRQIKIALESKASRDQNVIVATNVIQEIAKHVSVPIPNWVIEKFEKQLKQTIELTMESMGCAKGAIEQRLDNQSKQIRNRSERNAKRKVITTLLARHFEVVVNEEAIIAKIAEMAAEQGKRPEELRKELGSTNKLQNVALGVMEDNAMKKILDIADVQDISSEEWEKSHKTKV